MMVEMILWSGQFDKKTAAGKDFLERAKTKRDSLIEEMTNKLRKEHLLK